MSVKSTVGMLTKIAVWLFLVLLSGCSDTYRSNIGEYSREDSRGDYVMVFPNGASDADLRLLILSLGDQFEGIGRTSISRGDVSKEIQIEGGGYIPITYSTKARIVLVYENMTVVESKADLETEDFEKIAKSLEARTYGDDIKITILKVIPDSRMDQVLRDFLQENKD